MKKITHGKEYYVPKILLVRLLLMTKLILILVFTGTLQAFAVESKAQAKVSIRMKTTTLKNIFKEIEKQTSVRFIYNDDVLPLDELSNVYVNDEPWTKTLSPILNMSGLSYSVMEENLVVISKLKAPTSQQFQIGGRVVDQTGEALIGVSVIEKGTTRGTTTNLNGEFTLNVTDANSTVEFRYVGYLSQEVIVTSETLSIVMQENLSDLEEVVIVGYGTQKRANLTGAVSSVDMEKVIGDRPMSSSSQALQGALPGLQITSGSGLPGEGTSMNIRGATSINGGSPLVLVDNVPMSIDDVNPKDIQNVTILKDAAAASIYGARAAFGVVLVTTKKAGRNQPIKFNYSSNVTWSNPTTLPEKASPIEFAKALRDFGNTTYWTGQNVSTWIELLEEYGNNPSLYPDGITQVDGLNYPLKEKDLYGAVFPGGFEQLHNFSFSGGSEKTSYRVSGMFADEDGIMATDNDSHKRYNFNSYLSTELTKGLTASANVFYKNNSRSTPANMGEMFYRATTFSSYVDPGYGVALNGDVLPYGTPNNYLATESPSTRHEDNLRLFGKLEYNPIVGLNINAEYTFNKETNNNRSQQIQNEYINPMTYDRERLFNNSNYTRASGLTNYHALNVYASYLTSFGEHNFKVLAGTNQEISKSESYSVTRQDVLSPTAPSLNTSSGTITANDYFGEYAISGYFGRLNYDYKGRYLLEVNGRIDGSSRFADGDRYGFFPSFSAGWNISEEEFMQPITNIIPLLKVRGSFGEIGNQVVLDQNQNQIYYPVVPEMSTKNAGWINPETGVRYLTINPPGLVSAGFTWETVRTLNLGIDVALVNGKLNGSFDWFKRQTIGMLYRGAELPGVLGTSSPFQNVTDLESKGWETEWIWRDRISEFNYSVGFNLSDNRGYITRFNNSNGRINDYYVGQELGEIWGFVSDGYYTEADFVPGSLDANLMNGTLREGIPYYQGVNQNPGDIKYADLDQDGTIFTGDETLVNPGDRKIIGNDNRRYQFGITTSASYKNFDLSIFLQGVGKRDLWLSNQLSWPYGDQFGTLYKHNLDFWTPENTDAYYGRVYANAGTNTGANRRVQTKYLKDGSYLRVKNITLGYTVPKEALKGLFFDNIKLYASGENLFLKDDLPAGMEADGRNISSGGIYPYLKKYSFGINLTF